MPIERLYLIDEATGEAVMLAQAHGHGWDWWATPRRLTDWLENRDRAAAYSRIGGPTGLRMLTASQVAEYRAAGNPFHEQRIEPAGAAVQVASRGDLLRKVDRLSDRGA